MIVSRVALLGHDDKPFPAPHQDRLRQVHPPTFADHSHEKQATSLIGRWVEFEYRHTHPNREAIKVKAGYHPVVAEAESVVRITVNRQHIRFSPTLHLYGGCWSPPVPRFGDAQRLKYREWMGIETPPFPAVILAIPHTGGANSGALALNDPVLVALVEAWPTLPEAIKAAVRALVECQK